MKKTINIGLIDADLLDAGTRHPNLALMKIAGFLNNKKINYSLVTSRTENLECYDFIFLSKVFTFTKEPENISNYPKNKLLKGGTGYYADEKDDILFEEKRYDDLTGLNKNRFLKELDIQHEMPDYSLYNEYIKLKISEGVKAKHYKDYIDYSIGFFTRGCIRKCPFCVNKNISQVLKHSELQNFVDFQRPYIYLWDDNFLAYKNWKELLQQLIDTKKYFQFRQGLDLRLMTEEKAQMLATSNYHGDFLFAFDNINERFIIEQKLSLWKKYCKKRTKLFLFCGYTVNGFEEQYNDIRDLFIRIKIVMQYGCLPYVMRHQNYKTIKHSNIYTQIARWCNQPQFYKKMSFMEFCERNQYYRKTEGLCTTMKSYNLFLDDYKFEHPEIMDFFTMKYENLVDTLYSNQSKMITSMQI